MRKGNAVPLEKPVEYPEDPLTEVLRRGSRQLLAQAVEEEVEGFLEAHRELRDEGGRQRVVRNGYLPKRTIQTGMGRTSTRIPP